MTQYLSEEDSNNLLAQPTVNSDWKVMALYFADVAAATATDFALHKSTSKSEISRQQKICNTLIDSLNAGKLVSRFAASSKESIVNRLQNCLKLLEKNLEERK